jgi:hypothetical protein
MKWRASCARPCQQAKQRIALELNQRRLVLRETRPAREMVHDEVQSRLLAQQQAIQVNIEKLAGIFSRPFSGLPVVHYVACPLAPSLFPRNVQVYPYTPAACFSPAANRSLFCLTSSTLEM